MSFMVPASIRSLARELLIPAYGVSPLEKISNINIPYDQTSQRVVYFPKFSASGAVHLIGICFIPSDTGIELKSWSKCSCYSLKMLRFLPIYSSSSRDMPKSLILIWFSYPIKQFRAAKSRWIQFFDSKYRIPNHKMKQ